MKIDNGALLEKAREGDMASFDVLFSGLRASLRSYLFRITADMENCDDLIQDVFIKAYEGIQKFEGRSSLKTWIFAIATNHARRVELRQSRWHTDTHTRIRELAHGSPEYMQELEDTNRLSPHGAYEIKEHIDFCFTCVGKMLRIEEQVVILLKEIYGFKIKEIGTILEFSEPKVKHALRDGRQRMMSIFDSECALVNKNGMCNQCSELNGKFNPKQDARQKLMKIRMAAAADSHSRAALLNLRAELCRGIDPLQSSGTKLHEVFMKLCRMVNSE